MVPHRLFNRSLFNIRPTIHIAPWAIRSLCTWFIMSRYSYDRPSSAFGSRGQSFAGYDSGAGAPLILSGLASRLHELYIDCPREYAGGSYRPRYPSTFERHGRFTEDAYLDEDMERYSPTYELHLARGSAQGYNQSGRTPAMRNAPHRAGVVNTDSRPTGGNTGSSSVQGTQLSALGNGVSRPTASNTQPQHSIRWAQPASLFHPAPDATYVGNTQRCPTCGSERLASSVAHGVSRDPGTGWNDYVSPINIPLRTWLDSDINPYLAAGNQPRQHSQPSGYQSSGSQLHDFQPSRPYHQPDSQHSGTYRPRSGGNPSSASGAQPSHAPPSGRGALQKHGPALHRGAGTRRSPSSARPSRPSPQTPGFGSPRSHRELEDVLIRDLGDFDLGHSRRERNRRLRDSWSSRSRRGSDWEDDFERSGAASSGRGGASWW